MSGLFCVPSAARRISPLSDVVPPCGRRTLRNCLAALLLTAAAAEAGPAVAGAWTLPVGRGQVIVGLLASQATSGFDAAGVAEKRARYRKRELSAYAEYGVFDGFTAIGRGEYRQVDEGDPVAQTASGLGYTDFGARVRVWHDGATVLSAEVTARMTADDAGGSPALSGSADGELDLRGLYGRAFAVGGWPGFVDLQLAYRLRGGAQPDELRSDLTFGVRPRPDLLLLAQGFGTFAVTDASESAYSYEKLQVSAVYDLDSRISLQLGGVATVAGTDALRERGLVAAVWYRF
ncbi:hypothetical protein [Mangrovibrevibacter kandeliae]|uniref:hypothetical protein n=1 Tax=Mangrovibrevibacter kandeliae TaxID=2968473 RepID=UPI0021183BD5|nr:hypothetical protein [Aurantimonas sp. CSK15Z-1]